MSKLCPKCHTTHNKPGIFCSRKCANSRTITEEHKYKTSSTLRSKPIKNQFGYFEPRIKVEIVGPYTKIYKCVCKFSGRVWYSTTAKQVHPDLARSKKEYAYSCQFRFGISSFPKWFSDASELIAKYGWYSTPGSRKGKTNLNGISRDHLYSITDGWLNDVPPNIIRHPANCSLIPHKENQSKHRKSKITLEELYERISKFESENGEG
jgi:hypothetical protein